MSRNGAVSVPGQLPVDEPLIGAEASLLDGQSLSQEGNQGMEKHNSLRERERERESSDSGRESWRFYVER
mgnify:CR=1 FL=1